MNTHEAKRETERSIDKAKHSASADQAKGKTKQFIGKVKEKVGDAIGDDELAAKGTAQHAAGKTDEIKGDIKQKIDDAKSTVKGAAEAVKEKFDDARH
jgi:uncharacterized protein YjbJ (UPF0337 family)